MIMNNDKIVFFIPTRKGSERVLNKNTIPFAGIDGGILKLKLNQLINIEEVDEIILSTNDDYSMSVAESLESKKIKVVKRPDYLCLSSTVIEDFINYIPSIIDGNHVFWLHATSPLVSSNTYINALNIYKKKVIQKKEFDSLLSVNKIQQFLWDPEKQTCINHDRSLIKWPRTQDLKPIYEINHAFYINSIDNYKEYNDRIGINPYLYELNKFEGFDIDWVDDFKIAEILYNFLQEDNSNNGY